MKIPESTKGSLEQKLRTRQRERWPRLREIRVRYRGEFAYADAVMTDGETSPLFRLRYAGRASVFGFATHLRSREGYEDSVLPNGPFGATPQDAVDFACGLYLADPSALVTN